MDKQQHGPAAKQPRMPNWVLKTDHGLDGDSLSYLDRMENNAEEELRRARERQIMDEGRALWEQKKREEEEQQMRELQEARELSTNRIFGRPGHGAPTGDIRKKKFTEHQLDRPQHRTAHGWDDGEESMYVPAPQHYPKPDRALEEGMPGDVLTFGRAGNGAPVRTKSGRIRTAITANPEIRFQANESVQKSISNNIRYATDPQEKALYHKELEEQIRERKEKEDYERQSSYAIHRELEEKEEGTQWGKPGPGGPYWRPSALTGQNFFDKMGWSGSADPRKRQFGIKSSEAENIKREMEETKMKKEMEHQDITSNVGLELVPLMKNKSTGNPKKDPSTGYMMSHSLCSTDVTKLADRKGTEFAKTVGHSEDKRRYWETLTGQVSEKYESSMMRREADEEEQKRHFQSWETYWGRPGYGAPRGTTNKENLMKLLHYPEKAPNSVELITLERLPVK